MALALGLTLATGAVDAVSYFALGHVFTANMSGNMAFLGIAVAQGVLPFRYLLSLGGFALGAALAWRWIRTRTDGPVTVLILGLRAQIVMMLVLAVVLGCVAVATNVVVRSAVTFVLAAAMGLQTALARNIGVVDVNTTVATMTLHSLAADSRIARGASTRWRRRVGVVAALFTGAAIAVLADRVTAWGGMAVASVTVAIVSFGARQLTSSRLLRAPRRVARAG